MLTCHNVLTGMLACRLLFALYHVGLFTTLLLGQIGVNGRRQGYW